MKENLIEMAKDERGWDVRVILRVFILYQPMIKVARRWVKWHRNVRSTSKSFDWRQQRARRYGSILMAFEYFECFACVED